MRRNEAQASKWAGQAIFASKCQRIEPVFALCSTTPEDDPDWPGKMNALKRKIAIVEKKPRYANFKRKIAAAQMRKAADRILDGNCVAIAEVFSEASQRGHIPSVKLLYALAQENEKTGEGEGARKFRSMAEELAKATQWTGDWPKVKQHEDDEIASDA